MSQHLISVSLVDHLETHPAIGSALTISNVAAASILELVSNGRINPFIMDCFQLAAWTIAIFCGVITIGGIVKRKVMPFVTALFKKASAKKPVYRPHPTHSKKIQ